MISSKTYQLEFNRDVDRNKMRQLFCYMTLILYQVFSYTFYKLDVHSAQKSRLFQQLLFKFLKLI